MYNLIVYSGNYSKTSGRFWKCHRDEPALSDASADNINMIIFLVIVLCLNLSRK